MKNNKGILRLYLQFGNKETWKAYLKRTTFSNDCGSADSLWTMYGDYARYMRYFDEPVVSSYERLDTCMSIGVAQGKARDVADGIVEMLKENVILLADYFCEDGSKIVFYYFGDVLHEKALPKNAKTAKMYEYFEEDDDSNCSYVDRWMTVCKVKELTDREKSFCENVINQKLDDYSFEKKRVENRLLIKFSNAKADIMNKFFNEFRWNDDLSFFTLQLRMETAVEDDYTIDFSDPCLIPILARRICLMAVEVAYHRKRCTVNVEFCGKKKSDKKDSFSMLIDTADNITNVTISGHDEDGKKEEKTYCYKYGEKI